MARPAAEIEPQVMDVFQELDFARPIRPSVSRSMRTLREGSDLALDFCMENVLRRLGGQIADYYFSNEAGPARASNKLSKPFTNKMNRLDIHINTIFGAGMNFPSLFSPLKVGPYQLKHRVVMAPLTRMRAAKPSLAPRPLNAEYYAQRATPGGLIIAEASPVMATGFGNPGVPGIYSEQQIEGWREVVDAVHAKGGLIFLQLWHVGRVSHSSFQPGGALPVAPSAVPISPN